MSLDLITSVLAAVASLAAGGLASSELIQRILRRIFRQRAEPQKPYAERLSELTGSLAKATGEVNALLTELAQVARRREAAVAELEANLEALGTRERELKEKIEALEKTPLPVAEHFARLLQLGEKRSARRDYTLFGAGVVVTTLIAVLIQVFSG